MTTDNTYHNLSAQLDQFADQETYSPRFFSVDGRLGRVRYFAYYLGASLLGYLLIALAVKATAASWTLGVVLLCVAILLMLAGTLIMVGRRLHDLDLSRWIALLILAPYFNVLFGLYLLLAPGTKGRNRFGAMPEKNGRGVIVVACIVPAMVILGILVFIAMPNKTEPEQGQPAAPAQIPEASE
ncbi:hypothetical protein GCM10007907_23310 [Chitinimonas prasina]|uniref:DUF805 domain-containing protein n=1 Tax=Chitinimonas prasina TaxID=1434937 RepID=A0ABQ5YG29_9NEIS|nr:DUF805 domain-containing protein [Chitinimonas prasina]GLR13541.1 hypothetical protein GCM10007907_23310 [Chitinimonas prasina]